MRCCKKTSRSARLLALALLLTGVFAAGTLSGALAYKPQAGDPTGLDLYVLVKRLNRVHAARKTALNPAQSGKLYDLLEPLFEKPELDPKESRALVAEVRRALLPGQTTALDAIQNINTKSVMPPPPSGPPGGFGIPFGGPPPGFGPPGGMLTSSPRFNPFYLRPGNPLGEQAGRDLRELLDALDRAAPQVTMQPAPIALSSTQKISVTTFHYDLARTGWNARERVLSPRTVTKDGFGRLWYTPMDGQVYAAPLVVADADIQGRARDVVIAPTQNNTVYLLDADTGSILWKQHIADALSDVEYNDCTNITPLHGITSTPVLDLERRTIYVCGLMRSKLKQFYKVWALDLASGKIKDGWPVTLKGEYRGVAFDSGQLTQRGALTLVNGWLYIPFASRCDIGEWHGWIMGVNIATPDAPQRAFTPSPTASGGGMWGSAGLSADKDGNLYAVTGNGDYDLEQGGHNIVEAIIRLEAKESLAFSYQPKDYYVPSNYEELDRLDLDLGGSSALVFDHPGSATPHLLVTGGKDGFVYLVNRDQLGGVGGQIQKERLFGMGTGGYGSFIKTTPAYFEDGKGGQYLFVTGNERGRNGTQGVVALKLDLDAQKRSRFTPVWSTLRPLYQPGTAVVSSNGSADAIVWVIESNKNDDDDGPPGVLHAYDALTGRELYRSSQRERRDSLGDARKFSAPTVANGRVFCGTHGVVAYGPLQEKKHGK